MSDAAKKYKTNAHSKSNILDAACTHTKNIHFGRCVSTPERVNSPLPPVPTAAAAATDLQLTHAAARETPPPPQSAATTGRRAYVVLRPPHSRTDTGDTGDRNSLPPHTWNPECGRGWRHARSEGTQEGCACAGERWVGVGMGGWVGRGAELRSDPLQQARYETQSGSWTDEMVKINIFAWI